MPTSLDGARLIRSKNPKRSRNNSSRREAGVTQLRPRSEVRPVVAGVDAVLTIPVVILATACRTWRRHDVDNGRHDVDNGWHDVDNGRHGVDNGR